MSSHDLKYCLSHISCVFESEITSCELIEETLNQPKLSYQEIADALTDFLSCLKKTAEQREACNAAIASILSQSNLSEIEDFLSPLMEETSNE